MTTGKPVGSPIWLIAILPLLAIVQVAAGSLHDLTGMGASIPERSAANDTPAVPAVYAFAVWGLIFLWCFAFASFQARPAARASRLVAGLRGPAALAFVLNAAWEIHAQLAGLAWTSFALIVALLLPLLAAVERIRRFDGPIVGSEHWLAIVPLHVLAGWISVATFASLSTTLDVTGVLANALPAAARDVLLALLAGVVGAVFARRARAPLPYGLTVIWGLAGIIVKNTAEGGSWPVALAAGGAIAMVAGAAATRLTGARGRSGSSAAAAAS